MKRKKRIIVSAILISKDNKILLGKIREGGVYPNCWHIPGGGVDDGEDKEAALLREIREELDLDITGIEPRLLSDSDTGETKKIDKVTGEEVVVKMYFNVYQIDLDKNAHEIRISLNDDLKEYQWVSKKDLKNYKHTPPSKKLFKSLGWL